MVHLLCMYPLWAEADVSQPLFRYLRPPALGICCLLAMAAFAQDAAPVRLETAAQRLLAPVTLFPGTVISRNDARLAAEVEARLVWVAEVGTRVAQGGEVARLDDTLIRQERDEHLAAVAREQARLKFFTQEVRRLTTLAKQNNAAQSQLEQAISDRGVARSELGVALARAAQAQERLERTVVKTPFSGVVTERLMQAGEWAESGEEVVRLVDPASLEVQARVPASNLAHISEGSQLRLHANPGETLGTVRTIVPVGDDRSRLYELRLTFTEMRWPAGQTLRVAVPTAAPREVLAVPRDALVLRREGASVFRILEDCTAERVTIATGSAAGVFIEVNGGIVPGDRVVVRGGERLRPGQKVKSLGGIDGQCS